MALRRGTLHLGLGSLWGHLGPFWADLAPCGPISASRGPFLAIFGNSVVADRRHPGVGGPNLVGRSAFARGPFRPSLGPQAIGVPEISNEAHLLVACCCWPLLGPFRPLGAHLWLPTAATRELGVQTHGDRVALRNGTFFLGLGSFWGHLGPFWPPQAHFWPFLAVMWLPTGTTRELGAHTWWVGAP